MLEIVLPVLFTVLLWWASTGLIAVLDGLPRHTFRWSLLGATLLAGAGVGGLLWSAGEATVTGAVTAFVAAILLWGWNEVAFLLGVVTGPVRHACPAGCSPGRRFTLALRTILWHELAVLATAGLVLWLTWDMPNQTGLHTFLLLWVMRISAKLNIFLGVPNLGEEFLPPHLAYLASYFRRRPMNLLFPLSITGATVATLMLGQATFAANAAGDPVGAAAAALLTALSFLALLEHWLMVLPLPAASLWSVYLGSRLDTRAKGPPPTPPITPGTNLAPSTLWRRS